MGEGVLIYEVGPRDGLQNEGRFIETARKIELVNMLTAAGLRKIEVASFVSPKWVPQMADAAEVMAGIQRASGTIYSALTPNRRGAEAALEAGADEMAIFASASEAFSQKNINCSIAESLERFLPVVEIAQRSETLLRGYVSCVTDCPYQGSINPDSVASVVKRLLALGCYEVSLGDTLGRATPETTRTLLQVVLGQAKPSQLAGHFHNTGGRALENIDVCIDFGMRTFDAAVGGLGGCPYAPGARGNVATEEVLARLTERGFETGVDQELLLDAAKLARTMRDVA